MTQFSSDAWNRNLPIFHNILEMPFHWELGEGTLATERFRHYMIQDAHDLDGFARALSLASAKGLNADDVVHLAGLRRPPSSSSGRSIPSISRHSESRLAISLPPNPRLSANTTSATCSASPHSNRSR